MGWEARYLLAPNSQHSSSIAQLTPTESLPPSPGLPPQQTSPFRTALPPPPLPSSPLLVPTLRHHLRALRNPPPHATRPPPVLPLTATHPSHLPYLSPLLHRAVCQVSPRDPQPINPLSLPPRDSRVPAHRCVVVQHSTAQHSSRGVRYGTRTVRYRKGRRRYLARPHHWLAIACTAGRDAHSYCIDPALH